MIYTDNFWNVIWKIYYFIVVAARRPTRTEKYLDFLCVKGSTEIYLENMKGSVYKFCIDIYYTFYKTN